MTSVPGSDNITKNEELQDYIWLFILLICVLALHIFQSLDRDELLSQIHILLTTGTWPFEAIAEGNFNLNK